MLEPLPEGLAQALEKVRASLRSFERVVVSYSGVVDSALVAALAAEQLGDRALAITGVSPALAPHLRAEAAEQATWLGLRQQELPTAELDDPAYTSNPPEAEIAVIPGAELIPLDQIENGTAIERVRQLAAGKQLYAHCKLGGRSAKALIALKRHGIEGINVAGAIDAWSQDVDPSVPRY